MRFRGDRPQVRDEAGVAQNAAGCAWLWRWKRWRLKRAAFLPLTDAPAKKPFTRCSEERCYSGRLAPHIGEFSDSDAVTPASFPLFLFA